MSSVTAYGLMLLEKNPSCPIVISCCLFCAFAYADMLVIQRVMGPM